MKKKVAALSIKTLGFIALAMWFYAGYLYSVFRTYPTAPSLDTGKVIPFLWKTQSVYISEAENLEYKTLFYGSWIVFLVFVIAYKFAQKKFQDPKLFPDPELRESPGRGQKIAMIVIGAIILILALSSFLKLRVR